MNHLLSEQENALIHAAWQRMLELLHPLNLRPDLPSTPPDFQQSERRIDPYDGSSAFYGFWTFSSWGGSGNVILHAEGKIFMEVDVLQPHPKRSIFFVEGVTVWGTGDALKADLKLLENVL